MRRRVHSALQRQGRRQAQEPRRRLCYHLRMRQACPSSLLSQNSDKEKQRQTCPCCLLTQGTWAGWTALPRWMMMMRWRVRTLRSTCEPGDAGVR